MLIVIVFITFSKSTIAQIVINDSIKTDTNSYCFSGQEIKRIAATTLKYRELVRYSDLQDSLIKSILISYEKTENDYNKLNISYSKLDKKHFIFRKRTYITAAIVVVIKGVCLLLKQPCF
jgi:hypothetical protein